MSPRSFRRTGLASFLLGAALAAACAPRSITPMPTTREADPVAANTGPGGPACRSNDDCAKDKDQQCFAPDFHPGPGVAPEPCPNGSTLPNCEKCTPTSCAAGEECDPSGECVARRCTHENELVACPHNYGCGSDGRCTRKGCKRDAECEGACVMGLCFARPGACEPQSYCCPP